MDRIKTVYVDKYSLTIDYSTAKIFGLKMLVRRTPLLFFSSR